MRPTLAPAPLIVEFADPPPAILLKSLFPTTDLSYRVSNW